MFAGRTARGQGTVRLAPVARSSAAELGVLGAVVDATQDARGRIFILDAQSRITVVDQRLKLLGMAQQRATGAMFFREPAAIRALAGDRVAVLDRARRRIYVMHWVQGTGALDLVDSLSLGMPAAEAMCVLPGGKYLVYGAYRGRRLHIFNEHGTLERSFAPIDSTIPRIAHEQLTKGRIGCASQGDEVIVTSAFLPTVEALSIRTGAPAWLDTLRPYRPTAITIRASSMTFRTSRAGHSLVRTALPVDGCRLFQAAYVGRQDEGADTVLTYLFNSARRWEPAQLGIPLVIPLERDGVMSLAQSGSRIELQHLRIEGCTGPSRGVTQRASPPRAQSHRR